MFASKGTFATAGSRLRTYGGVGGIFACRCASMRCTKVDLPEPAIPIAMIQTGFFLVDMVESGEKMP